MMNRIKTKFDKMPIVKKVTILYAFLFTVTIAAISVILLITSKGMGVGIAFTTLQNCSETIENYIVSGNDLSGTRNCVMRKPSKMAAMMRYKRVVFFLLMRKLSLVMDIYGDSSLEIFYS